MTRGRDSLHPQPLGGLGTGGVLQEPLSKPPDEDLPAEKLPETAAQGRVREVRAAGGCAGCSCAVEPTPGVCNPGHKQPPCNAAPGIGFMFFLSFF